MSDPAAPLPHHSQISFGKHRGRLLKDILRNDSGYFRWMMDADFPRNTKWVLQEIHDGLKNA